MIINDTLEVLNAQAKVALELNRELRNMTTPAVSLPDISARLSTHLPDLSPTQINLLALQVGMHPSLRQFVTH